MTIEDTKIAVNDECLEMLDTLRHQNGVTHSRRTKLKHIIKDTYEKAMTAPKKAEPYPPKDLPRDPLAYLYRDGSRFGSLSGSYLHNWGPQPQFTLTPEKDIEDEAQTHLDALHDLVDAVAELSAGPVTVTAEAPIKGGGTYRMTATIDYGLREKS